VRCGGGRLRLVSPVPAPYTRLVAVRFRARQERV